MLNDYTIDLVAYILTRASQLQASRSCNVRLQPGLGYHTDPALKEKYEPAELRCEGMARTEKHQLSLPGRSRGTALDRASPRAAHSGRNDVLAADKAAHRRAVLLPWRSASNPCSPQRAIQVGVRLQFSLQQQQAVMFNAGRCIYVKLPQMPHLNAECLALLVPPAQWMHDMCISRKALECAVCSAVHLAYWQICSQTGGTQSAYADSTTLPAQP